MAFGYRRKRSGKSRAVPEHERPTASGATRACWSNLAGTWKTATSTMHPPRELRPSLRGVFDLQGNLFEWTHDWYSGDFGAGAVPIRSAPRGARPA